MVLGNADPSTFQVIPLVFVIASRTGYGSVAFARCTKQFTDDRVTPTPTEGLRKSIDARSAAGTREPALRTVACLGQGGGFRGPDWLAPEA
jgi:hypothetical protein